jgi:mannitol/fructose-specific phosphotransferase system IIA component (Ntr-type)
MMDLLTLTQERYAWTSLSASRKDAAIEQLLDLLMAEGAFPQSARGEVLEAVMTRERRLSTGLENGVAIPHGTTSVVEREVAALGIFPQGVPFDAVDDHDTKIVILLVTPHRERHRHVTNLAAIARQLLSSGVREAILAASNREEVFAAIRAAGGG